MEIIRGLRDADFVAFRFRVCPFDLLLQPHRGKPTRAENQILFAWLAMFKPQSLVMSSGERLRFTCKQAPVCHRRSLSTGGPRLGNILPAYNTNDTTAQDMYLACQLYNGIRNQGGVSNLFPFT